MLKIRLQGTLKDIQWFRRILEKHKELDVLEVSDAAMFWLSQMREKPQLTILIKTDSSLFQNFSQSKIPLIPDFPLIQRDMKSKERKVHGLFRIIF